MQVETTECLAVQECRIPGQTSTTCGDYRVFYSGRTTDLKRWIYSSVSSSQRKSPHRFTSSSQRKKTRSSNIWEDYPPVSAGNRTTKNNPTILYRAERAYSSAQGTERAKTHQTRRKHTTYSKQPTSLTPREGEEVLLTELVLQEQECGPPRGGHMEDALRGRCNMRS